jgi:hypothetical protein
MIASRAARGLACVGAVVFYTYFVFRFFNSLDDDAMIPIRYGLNFLAGGGWGLNPGERVEGVTSPLHLWIVTFLLRYLSPDQAIGFLKVAGYFIGLGVLRCVWLLGRRLAPDHPMVACLAVLFLGIRTEFALSMTNGLETGLATLFVSMGLVVFLQEKERDFRDRIPVSCILLALAAIARPELILLAPLLVAWTVRGRAIARYGVTFGIPILAVEAWRIAYYGDIVPNTFYAKHVSLADALVPGFGYIQDFGAPFCFPFIFVLVFSTALAWQFLRAHGGEVLATVLIPIGFAVLSGGCYMQDGRFLAPAMPGIALITAAAVFAMVTFQKSSAGRLATAGVLGFLVFCGVIWRFVATTQVFGMASAAEMRTGEPLIGWRCAGPAGRRMMANWIHKHVPPGELVACSEAA